MKERKSITYTWKTLKILTFVIFFYTSAVMFKLRNTTIAILIIFAASLFLIFNRLENIDRRIKELEGK